MLLVKKLKMNTLEFKKVKETIKINHKLILILYRFEEKIKQTGDEPNKF